MTTGSSISDDKTTKCTAGTERGVACGADRFALAIIATIMGRPNPDRLGFQDTVGSQIDVQDRQVLGPDRLRYRPSNDERKTTAGH